MRLAKLTLGFIAVSAVLFAAPAIADTVTVNQNPDPANNTSFSGNFSVTGLAASSTFSDVVQVVSHAGGPFMVTVNDIVEGGSGFKSLTATVDGTPITLTSVGSGSSVYSGSALINIPNGINTINIGFSGKTGSSSQDFIAGKFSFTAVTPEPAAWIMMITGLAFVGGMLRRQRQALVA